MRSKTTNLLQAGVLFTGLVYIILGIVFSLSPFFVIQLFVENFPADWLKQIINNEIVAPLYFILRAFSALMLVNGLAMIMPLFDPLKYRAMIFFFGVLSPLLSALILISKGMGAAERDFGTPLPVEGADLFSRNGHTVITVLAVIFCLILAVNAAGLVITRKNSGEGIE